VEEESQFYNNAIFWIEVDRIRPNPYQPRRQFDQTALQSLADSIRQYGVLQPLVVSRYELERDDGGLSTEYELIAGERRWRASRLAGLSRVPALIRAPEQSDKIKLELAIIENLQREDLNPIERAEAFHKLVDEFGFKHTEVAKKIGKSREYVSNSIRLLALPDEIKDAVTSGRITEGHARPMLMLGDRPDEQSVLFKEINIKKLTVRESEDIARRIAHDKVRKQIHTDPKMLSLEKELSDLLGTRVRIEQKAVGGKITIDFFSDEDLQAVLLAMNAESDDDPVDAPLEEQVKSIPDAPSDDPEGSSEEAENAETLNVEKSDNSEALDIKERAESPEEEQLKISSQGDDAEIQMGNDLSAESGDASTPEQKDEDDNESDDDLYSIQNFSL